MIKTLIKLAIVALLVNGCWQLLNAYWPYYKFKDAVSSTTLYRGEKSNEQIRARIIELAEQFDQPVTDEKLTVDGDNTHTIVDVSYVRTIDLAPGWKYPWPFTVHVDTVTLKQTPLNRLEPK
jgi:hypothetical protein